MSLLAKRIHLFETEMADLQVITRKGTHKTRVRTLLLLGTGKSRQTIEAKLGISASQYWQTRQ